MADNIQKLRTSRQAYVEAARLRLVASTSYAEVLAHGSPNLAAGGSGRSMRLVAAVGLITTGAFFLSRSPPPTTADGRSARIEKLKR